MAAGNLDDDEGIVAINITPMVDIILVLLVIFMVTTTTAQSVEGLEVDKPDASTGQDISEQDKPTSILLECDAKGNILVDGAEVKTDREIISKIKEKVAENSDIQGIVQCDEAAEVGKMVHLIDLLRENEVKRYAIATEQPQEDKG